MNKPLLPVALLLVTAFGLAPAIENAKPSSSALGTSVIASQISTQAAASSDKPWYIGPKGGDIRKENAIVWSNTITNAHIAAPYSIVAAERPWFIGPKGGNISKGAFKEPWHAVVAHDPATKSLPDSTKQPWYIGPKGGDIRKGH